MNTELLARLAGKPAPRPAPTYPTSPWVAAAIVRRLPAKELAR